MDTVFRGLARLFVGAAAIFSMLALVGCGNPASDGGGWPTEGFRSIPDSRAGANGEDAPALLGGDLVLGADSAWVLDDGRNSCNIFDANGNGGEVKTYYRDINKDNYADIAQDNKWIFFGTGKYGITDDSVLTVERSGVTFKYIYGVYGPLRDSLTIRSGDGFSVLFVKTGGIVTDTGDAVLVGEDDPGADLILDGGDGAWRHRDGDRVFGVVFRANARFVVIYYRGTVSYGDDDKPLHNDGDWLIVGTGAWEVTEDTLTIQTAGGPAVAAYDVSGGYMVLEYGDTTEIYTELNDIAVSIAKARERKKDSTFFLRRPSL